MKIAIFGIKTSQEIYDLILKTIDVLKLKSCEINFYKPFFINLGFSKNDFNFNYFSSHIDLKKDIDLFLTFGGDGTILSAIPIIQNSNIPIVGINTGRLGFVTTFAVEEFFNRIDDVLNKKFKISKRTLLSVSGDFNLDFPFALNEIAISRKETTSMIIIEAFVNGEYLNKFWGDGLIISTPTGSTGYNLSCGGPILFPENKTISLTPIAPHNLNVRPLTLPNDVVLKFTPTSRASQFSLSLDSRLTSLPAGIELTVKICPFEINLVIPENYSYFDTLRKKLHWGIDARN